METLKGFVKNFVFITKGVFAYHFKITLTFAQEASAKLNIFYEIFPLSLTQYQGMKGQIIVHVTATEKIYELRYSW